MQRRGRLKLQAFPTTKEKKVQMHNFAVLFWACCQGSGVCNDKRCWGGSKHSDRQWPTEKRTQTLSSALLSFGDVYLLVLAGAGTCPMLISASWLTTTCVYSYAGNSSTIAGLQASLVHRKGNWATSILRVFCSRNQHKKVKRRTQKAKYQVTNKARRSWQVTQIAVGCWREASSVRLYSLAIP